MRLTLPFAATLLVVLAATTACSDSSASPNAKSTEKPTETATATPTDEASETDDAEPYVDVIEYARTHGFAELPDEMASEIGPMCDSIDGEPLDGPLVKMARDAFATAGSGPDSPWNKRQAAEMFDVLIEGCVASGYITIPEGELSYDDVITLMNLEHGYSLDHDESINSWISRTCQVLHQTDPSSSILVTERQKWVDWLGDSWSKAQANKFVDVLFEACYETGHSERP